MMHRYFSIILAIGLLTFNACQKDDLVRLTLPDNISASDDYALKNVINWNIVDGAEGYYIYRAEYDYYTFDGPDDMDFVRIGTATKNAYEDKCVVSSNTYYYKVEAYNGSTISPISNAIIGYTTNLTAEEAFIELASSTGGEKYEVKSAPEVPETIIEIINNHIDAGADLVFLMDNTASMWDDIGQIKSTITNILSNIPPNTNIAIASYADANFDNSWHTWVDFTTNLSTIQTFIQNIELCGGGDIPESVYDGIYKTIDNLTWTSSKRIIIVIGDAVPLEGNLSTYTFEDIITKCSPNNSSINLYPILISSN